MLETIAAAAGKVGSFLSKPSNLMSIGALAEGTGSLMTGAGALGGSEGEQSMRDIYPSESFDYLHYAQAMQRETRNKILNMIAKRSYEGYEGGKNLGKVGYAAAMEAAKTPAPDYFAQSKDFAVSDNRYVTDVLASFSPSTTAFKDESEKTEWDRIAEKNGIVVTKYNDFNSRAELMDALFEKNKSEVEVSDLEVLIGQKIANQVLSSIFGIPFDKLCGAGQCDDILAGVIRGVKALGRTMRQLGL